MLKNTSFEWTIKNQFLLHTYQRVHHMDHGTEHQACKNCDQNRHLSPIDFKIPISEDRISVENQPYQILLEDF